MDRIPRRPRLLLATPYYAAHGGGVESVAGHLAGALAQEGFEVAWVASDCDPPPFDCDIKFIPMRSSNAIERHIGVPVPLWTPAALRELRKAARQCDAIMMHESLYVPNLFLAEMARELSKPLILVQHVGDVPYRNRLLRLAVRAGNRFAARFVFRRATRIVFISETVREFFRTSAPALVERACLIANGVALERFRPVSPEVRASLRTQLGIPRDRTVMLFVGRFVEKKGLALLERLARERPGWTWVFAGAGPIDPDSWQLPNVRVVGRLSQEALSRWYPAADLLVLPSVGEGFPLVVQEAMACGLPTAISDETARALPGVAAHVYAEAISQDVQDTCAKLLLMLDAAAAGEAAARREKVARFAQEQWSWERCVREHRTIIEDALRTAGARTHE
jgi:glycosyltransferase involved in cell wall biosynthesis